MNVFTMKIMAILRTMIKSYERLLMPEISGTVRATFPGFPGFFAGREEILAAAFSGGKKIRILHCKAPAFLLQFLFLEVSEKTA